MKLSVIIPVYQVEQSLRRCVESVCNQNVDEMEIILVDDGSDDNSGRISDELSASNKRIKTIHQKNGGLSAARNTGLKIAKGEYITFVDSDDEVQENTYSQLMDLLMEHPEYDILEFPLVCHQGSSHEHLVSFESECFQNMSLYWTQCQAYQHSYACNKLFKRHTFRNVSFPEGVVFEDVWTLPKLLRNAKTVATTDKGLYLYKDNPQGITFNADKHDLELLLNAHMEVLNHHHELLAKDGFTEYFIHVANIQLDVFRRGGPILLSEKGLMLKPSEPDSFTNKMKAFLIKQIGIENTCRLHKIIKPSQL